jgi:hypothetical protein
MTTALKSLGGRVLSAVLPDIPVFACIPDDPYYVCANISGYCAAHCCATYLNCHNDCTGQTYCYELACCECGICV